MTDRQKLWLRMDRTKAGYRRAFRPLFVSALNKQIIPVLDLIEDANDIRDLEHFEVDNTAIEAVYRKMYLTTVTDFAKKKRAGLRKFLTKGDDEVFEDLINDKALTYLRVYGGETITAAGSTSLKLVKEMVRQITAEIIERNLTASEGTILLRDQLSSEWHKAARWRTERIVRTEVNRASNYGSLEGMKSIGVPMLKTWLSAFTEKSRPEHMDADGQKVALDDTFLIGSEKLQ